VIRRSLVLLGAPIAVAAAGEIIAQPLVSDEKQ